MWFPPLPNKGKVNVQVYYNSKLIDEYFCDHYQVLKIDPIKEYDGIQYFLEHMYVDDIEVTPSSKFYLGEDIRHIVLVYQKLNSYEMLAIIFEKVNNVSCKNYLPQIGSILDNSTFPRGCYYKGIKLDSLSIPTRVYAFPVDLDKEDFEIYRDGIKYTVRLNRKNKLDFGAVAYVYFDIIKAEFSGGLLPPEEIDDYVELKPKGE